MFTLTINGKQYTYEQDRRLLDILRNDLGLKSVKDGCSEGACGTCTVLIDGKAVKACVQKLSRLDGKTVQTVEGGPCRSAPGLHMQPQVLLVDIEKRKR